jgi:hypothetical protein
MSVVPDSIISTEPHIQRHVVVGNRFTISWYRILYLHMKIRSEKRPREVRHAPSEVPATDEKHLSTPQPLPWHILHTFVRLAAHEILFPDYKKVSLLSAHVHKLHSYSCASSHSHPRFGISARLLLVLTNKPPATGCTTTPSAKLGLSIWRPPELASHRFCHSLLEVALDELSKLS